MTADFRALCAELLAMLDAQALRDPEMDGGLLRRRARTALAQPEPDVATDEEILALAESHEICYNAEHGRVEYPFVEGHDMRDELLSYSRALIALCAIPTIKPVSVAERLPKPGRKVLAHYLNALGKPRTIIAEWVPAKTREDSSEGDLGEYDDETDLFYWPEGWYEQIENWDDFTALLVDEGEITHWQPLPRGPHHALPLPQP
jgi:hypothetical protein